PDDHGLTCPAHHPNMNARLWYEPIRITNAEKGDVVLTMNVNPILGTILSTITGGFTHVAMIADDPPLDATPLQLAQYSNAVAEYTADDNSADVLFKTYGNQSSPLD